MSEFDEILDENGFDEKEHTLRAIKNKTTKEKHNNVHFKLPFVNDRCNRKINKLIKHYDLPPTLMSLVVRQNLILIMCLIVTLGHVAYVRILSLNVEIVF